MTTPEWIAELTREDRNRIDNGIHPAFDTWKLHSTRAHYAAVIDDLHKEYVEQPSLATNELVVQLLARIELIDERINQIETRKAEWNAWRPHNRDCNHHVPGGCDRCKHNKERRRILGAQVGMLCGHGYFDPCPVCEGDEPAEGECEL
jgi:hypothetical protein